MHTLLITGLDGSGKSTLLNRLRNQNLQNTGFVNLPHSNLDDFTPNTILYDTAKFINELSGLADKEQVPQLKAIALLAAMLLYQKIEESKSELKLKTLICERHPLVDTDVYAAFYAGKLPEGSLPVSLTKQLSQQYAAELDYITSSLPAEYRQGKQDALESIRHFIYEWFYLQKKTSLHDMRNLFGVDVPDELFFLSAKPEILYARLQDREVKEAHESVKILHLLNGAYQTKIQDLQNNSTTKIHVLSCNTPDEMDAAYQYVTTKINK